MADIGRDGDVSVPGFINERVSRDVMSYAIDYFGGEYKPIQTGSPLDFTTSIPQNLGTGKDLFNGNIRATTVHLSQLGGAKTYSYSYDQLNRIVKMRKHETSFTYTGSGTPAITVASPTTEYQENITYDANGNILTDLRNGSSSQLAMDNLVYRYTTTHNRLRYVDDGVNAANYAEDIDDQASGNYNYDRIGNLTLDVKEKISNIEWTVYGKIKKITKNDAAGTVIEYEYDASGNRIYKKVSANKITSYTFYVRDAQGNALAVYTKEDQDPIKWSEQHLYGSSRMGMVNLNITVPSNISWPTPGNTLQDGFDYGKTVYELSNHLGNVLATITDQKDAVQNGSTGVVGYYKAVSMTQTDYYPFGMQMVGRTYRLLDGYRYGFNGKENDDEVKGVEGSQQDYGFRIYDPRVARFLSVDPLTRDYPWFTPYQFAGNIPISSIDLDGAEPVNALRGVSSATNKITAVTWGFQYNAMTHTVSLANGIAVDPAGNVLLFNQKGGLAAGLTFLQGGASADISIGLAFAFSIYNYRIEQLEDLLGDGKSVSHGISAGPLGFSGGLELSQNNEMIGATIQIGVGVGAGVSAGAQPNKVTGLILAKSEYDAFKEAKAKYESQAFTEMQDYNYGQAVIAGLENNNKNNFANYAKALYQGYHSSMETSYEDLGDGRFEIIYKTRFIAKPNAAMFGADLPKDQVIEKTYRSGIILRKNENTDSYISEKYIEQNN